MKCAWKVTALVLIASLNGTAVLAQPTTVRGIDSPMKTETPAQFLSSLADKFGTSADQLEKLLAKIPPHGRGLNFLELAVISSRLGLSKDEKAVLKSRIGSRGTGFTRADVAGMGSRLGLNSTQIAKLSEQLGLASPTVATRTLFSPAVIEGTAQSSLESVQTDILPTFAQDQFQLYFQMPVFEQPVNLYEFCR